MAILSKAAIQEKLKTLSAWSIEGGELVREFEFRDFVAAIEFVNWVAEKSEAASHHPNIDIRYNKVRLALVSHDAGGLTERDFDLAASIEALKSSLLQ